MDVLCVPHVKKKNMSVAAVLLSWCRSVCRGGEATWSYSKLSCGARNSVCGMGKRDFDSDVEATEKRFAVCCCKAQVCTRRTAWS